MQYNENYSSSVKPSSKWGGKDDKGYAYKKSSYQYSSSGNNNVSSYTSNPTTDKNIDQLDALLEDLKTERQITRDRDLLSTGVSYRTLERERAEPAGTITKTTRVIRTTKQGGGHQEGLDDDRLENFSTSDYSTLKSNGYSTLNSNAPYDDYQTGERSFGARNMYESKSKIYESNRTLENTGHVPQLMTTTTTSNLAKDLQNIALTDDILPLPGTKVTTTVRTYTYEVPAESAGHTGPVVASNRLQQHNTLNYNSTTQKSNITNAVVQPQQPHPAVNTPQTVVYNTESYSTINKNDERPVVSNQTYEIREHRETNTLRNHLTPQQPRSPVVGSTGGTTKIIYNTENIHTVPVPIVPEPNQYTLHGPNIPTGSPHSPLNGHLPPGSTTNRYYYKESTNSVNTIHGPGGGPGILEPQHPTHIAPPTSAPRYPPSGDDYHPPGYPPNPSTVTYKYNSSTTNTRRGIDYGTPSPSTQLGPFPVDGLDYPGNGNPPQRVDDLMQSFSNADTTDRPDLETTHRKREIETSVASPNQQQIPSINKVGKEVYYPPGHETMLTKREEMSSGSAAGGRWAKGSGMYEYESGSKSKTTSKSGGAMVPVCLPLCCAMPCSIM